MHVEENPSETALEECGILVKAVLKLAFVSLFMGFLVLLEQYMANEIWFDTGDIHHETFAVAFFSLGFGILMGFVGRRRRTQS